MQNIRNCAQIENIQSRGDSWVFHLRHIQKSIEFNPKCTIYGHSFAPLPLRALRETRNTYQSRKCVKLIGRFVIYLYTLFHEKKLTFFSNIIGLPERRNKSTSVLEITKNVLFLK